jgi:hypothetical protein
MKKLWILTFAVCLAFSLTAMAQETGKSCDTGKDKMAAAPLKTLKGTVKSEGDKISFVSDADQKSWDVVNPEMLKDHVGHHVQLSAHVYADKGQIHVMTVKMLKASKANSSL